MKLLTDELRAQLPPLYAQEKEKDPMVYLKFFTPWTSWTWYITEGSPEGEDFIFFGYVIGLEREWVTPHSMNLSQSEAQAGSPLSATCISRRSVGAK